jgi:hypothetical protein
MRRDAPPEHALMALCIDGDGSVFQRQQQRAF